MFAQAIESILKDHLPEAVRAVEAGAPAAALQDAITGAGFLELLAEEADGGAALEMREVHGIVTLFGAYAVPLPLAQTLLARLLVRPHGNLPPGMITFAEASLQAGGGALVCQRVPFAMTADHVIASHQGSLLLLPASQARRVPCGVPGSLTASLAWDTPLPTQAIAHPLGAEKLQALGAVAHAGLLAGAMKRVFDMTLQYGNERVQFGKSIGKFQAIQHQLSVMAEHVAAASIAAEAAYQCGRRLPSLQASAVAKSRASEAASQVCAIAHAVHGAIGITHEYDLQLYTRRLHEWRMAHGSESHWNALLGRILLDSGDTLIADFARSVVA